MNKYKFIIIKLHRDFSHVIQNPHGRICIQFDDMSTVYNRHSFSNHHLFPVVHHMSLIEPLYGPTRNRASSIPTIDTRSIERSVEKLKINPQSNIVKDKDNLLNEDIPSASETSFDLNNY